MSKQTKLMARAMNVPFHSGSEAEFCAKKTVEGTPSLVKKGATESMNSASDILAESFDRFNAAFERMGKQELEMAQRTKVMTSHVKNYCGQIAESMARMDKIVAIDFERKLVLLERFVTAASALAELDKTGHLTKIANSIRN